MVKNRSRLENVKVLFICHGKKLLFWKNAGKSRVLGV